MFIHNFMRKNFTKNCLWLGSVIGISALFLYFKAMFVFKSPDNSEGKIFVENPPYKKLVFIVLDGLRIDGVVNTQKNSYYHNNFSFLSNLNDIHRKTFLSVSGLPTGTVFRVNSILTGFPSSFFNFSQIFSEKKMQLDSFVKKLPRCETFFYGDQTWKQLFKEIQSNSSTYSPYDKFRPTEEEISLLSKFTNEIGTYKYTLGHFVYLDHYGHIHGTQHPKIRWIMNIYDEMLKRVYEKIDDETLMVVLSDHGVNDDGSHGGASLMEISSFCSFLSKKPFFFQKNEAKNAIRRTFFDQKYNGTLKWIQSSDKIHLCHQDDIMPTICALIGISFPYFTTGNIIYEFFENEIPQKRLLEQKLLVLSDQKFQTENNTCIYRLNYTLSEKITSKFMSKDIKGLIKAFITFLSAQLLFLFPFIYDFLAKRQNWLVSAKEYISKNCGAMEILTIFVSIMVAHSVHSFLHEDYIWIFLYFFHDISIDRFVHSLLFCLIGRFPQHEIDRIVTIPKLKSNYEGLSSLGLLFLLYCTSFFKKNARLGLKKQICTIISENFIICAIQYLWPSTGREISVNLFISQPTMKNFALCLYSPLTYIYIHLYLNDLGSLKRPSELFSLLNSVIFAIEMNHALSSIKYEIFFLFSEKFCYINSTFIFVSYLFYPASIILQGIEKNSKTCCKLMVFCTFNVILASIIGLWFQKDWLFHLFFGGRLFFVSGYYLFICIWMIYISQHKINS